jgi:hypothetical protein
VLVDVVALVVVIELLVLVVLDAPPLPNTSEQSAPLKQSLPRSAHEAELRPTSARAKLK